MGWLADILFGKMDPNPIYDGMYESDRRKYQAREEHIKRRKDKIDWRFNQLTENLKKLNGDEWNKSKSEQYYCLVMKNFYEAGYENSINYDSWKETSVLNKIFDWMLTTTDVNGPVWQKAIDLLREEKAILVFLPAIFDNRFSEKWNEFKVKKEAAAKAKAERERVLREADRPIVETIEALRKQIRQLEPIFRSSSGMSRMQIVTSIDVMTQRIAGLKSQLKVPIADDSVDRMGG